MKRIFWHIWRHEKKYLVVVFLASTMLLYYLYQLLKIPTNNPIQLSIKILSAIDSWLVVNWPLLSQLLSPIVGVVFTTVLFYLLKYNLIPGDKNDLLYALVDRCYEVTEVGIKRVERELGEVSKWVDGLRTGCYVTPKECKNLVMEVLSISKSRKLYSTCLQSPQQLHDNLQSFSGIIASEINKSVSRWYKPLEWWKWKEPFKWWNASMEFHRIIVCDENIFDLSSYEDADDAEKNKVKWFVGLHEDKLTLYCIDKEKFKEIALTYGIEGSKLDIMFFDKNVVYCLENDNSTLQVLMNNDKYTLSLLDSKEDIEKYKRFIEVLIKDSINVRSMLESKGWESLYKV